MANNIQNSYKLKGHTLELSTTISSKYLVVDIFNDLSWNPYIDRTTKKAHSMIGFLKRNLKTAKSNAYCALVRPHLEYCSTIWNLVCFIA